ncbi:hypothetical protein HJC23_011252 [Cyclotella cryptica]|uniref:Nitrogen permease regulator 2 n=1 Tax=Cyclotella cryptica TaxID=29204 RepID=A0ABD3QV73_9STRA|eukprot:CCRYP_001628-RA/>CCRYP_001628-RA protein AED:0.07 eAED:-0.08 QI:0/-1/0/1/-1/1/1/0/920
MTDPSPPPPCPSTTTPASSPLPSPRKGLTSSNQQSGSPSSSVGTDSKSVTPRSFTRRNSKQYPRGSITALNKSPGLGPSLDASTGDSSHTENALPINSLHTHKETKKSTTSSRKEDNINGNPHGIVPDPQNPNHRYSLPRPLPASKCPLLCVFYAEFDIVVGPMVCFQSPSKFMFFDINVGPNEINQSIEETFQHVMQSIPNPNVKNDNNSSNLNNATESIDQNEYWNWTDSLELRNSSGTKNNETDLSSQSTVPTSGKPSHRRKHTDGISAEQIDAAVSISSKGNSLHEDSTVDSETLQNSIFAATSEYIITGNELANQTITVSTHGMHILSRPMIISDMKRYERNSLLFSVGFVLRRSIDPRPYWPVLSNLSSTFRSMEVESEFLSHQRTRPMIQTVLEDVLVSLNSKQRDCHLLLNEANLLNLQLFQPPHPATPSVPDYAVPILLRPEWQLQMYDWDLTINWILPHIDGCKHVKQIAESSEVDMELVRSCLRVLRHHGVLSYVDVFRYCNVYECTPLAVKLFSPVINGDVSKKGWKMVDEAFWYSAKRKVIRQAPTRIYHSGNSPSSFSTSPLMNSLMARRRSQPTDDDFKPRSFPSRARGVSIVEEPSSDEDVPSCTSSPKRASSFGSAPKPTDAAKIEMNSFKRDALIMKKCLAGLYCACTRDNSFGDMLLSKISCCSNGTKIDNNEKHDVSLNSLDATMAPVYETYDLEEEQGVVPINVEAVKVRDAQGEDAVDIEWNKAFHFDHRRVISFGVTHGLIKRIHQYPLAYETQIADACDAEDAPVLDRKSSTSHDYDAVDSSQLEFSAEFFDRTSSEVALHAIGEADPITDENASAITPTLSHSSLQITEVDTGSVGPISEKSSLISLAERVALAMDGTRCDDELSCMFESPIEDLIEMVKNSGRWNVISVFSPEK